MTDVDAARRALEDAHKVRGDIAAKVRCPPHMHAIMGLLMGGMIAGQAGPPPISMAVLAICLCGVVLMVNYTRKRLGFFVNGFRRGRTLWVAISLLVFVEAVLALCVWLKDAHHLVWAPIVGGLVVCVVATAASYAWHAVYRADIQGRDGALPS